MAWPIHVFAIRSKESVMNRQILGCRGAAQAVRTNSADQPSVRTAHPTQGARP